MSDRQHEGPAPRRRWLMLALGTTAQAVASSLVFGMPLLLPYIRRTEGLTLAQGGALVAAPSLGMVVTLIAWGAFADRYGERLAIALGLGLTGVFGLASAGISGYHNTAALGVLFALMGGAGASVNSASGRLVMGWFGVHERGLAMGIRQMGLPLGLALAGALLPPLAGLGGLRLALAVPAIICLVVTAGVVLLATDPPHEQVVEQDRPQSPYRRLVLWRVHAASALLAVPQFAMTTFSAEYLVSERGWNATTAGQLLAVVAVGGAGGRLATGRWSDIAGSRLAPMRLVAMTACLSMLLVALTAWTGIALVVLALAIASIVSVSDNGLGFTATAELAGRAWSGRALGVQNTMQNIAAFATAPLVGGLAGSFGFPWAFAAVAVLPALGAWVTPVKGERRATA